MRKRPRPSVPKRRRRRPPADSGTLPGTIVQGEEGIHRLRLSLEDRRRLVEALDRMLAQWAGNRPRGRTGSWWEDRPYEVLRRRLAAPGPGRVSR